MRKLFQKRCDLIIDYISQILVYGNNTIGKITICNGDDEDKDFIFLTVSVIKNNYFRFHNLGIGVTDNKEFTVFLRDKCISEFKVFSLTDKKKSIIIESSVNNNKVELHFDVK